MHFSIFLWALRARYRVFLWILGSTVLAAMAASLIMPKSYVAKASILTDGRNEQSLSPGTQVYERERTGYLQTQVDILTSPTTARRVVHDLRLFDDAKALEAYRKTEQTGRFDDWLAEQLVQSLKVDTTQSSTIRVSYSADDPALAARVANGFAKAYVDNVLDLRVEPLKKASAWFDDQLKGLRENMAEAERRLTDFQREHGILAADERNDFESIRLTEMATLATRSAPTGQPDAGLASMDAAAAERASQSMQTLKSNLALARARLQQLSSQYGSRHPNVIRQSAEVDALSHQLDSERNAVAAGIMRAAEGARQRSRSLKAAMEAQRERVGNLREARTRLAVLTNDFANAQRTYDLAVQRAMASKIDSRAMLPNVQVLSEALPPSSAARPRMLINLALALVIGTLMGLAAVYFMEASDRRLRTIEDMAGDPQLPLLAVLNAQEPSPNRLLANPAGFPRLLTGPG